MRGFRVVEFHAAVFLKGSGTMMPPSSQALPICSYVAAGSFSKNLR